MDENENELEEPEASDIDNSNHSSQQLFEEGGSIDMMQLNLKPEEDKPSQNLKVVQDASNQFHLPKLK